MTGAIAGAVMVFATACVINESPIADMIVAPLLLPDSVAFGSADAVVVLGASVVGDCVPSSNAMRRAILGIRQWREQPRAVLIFAGGTGEPCTVAEAMARFARDFGVPADRVRVETASTNTHENAEFTSALLRQWGLSRVVLVTDRLHMRRAAAAFTRSGFALSWKSVPIYEGHDDNVAMLAAGLREYAALASYRMRGWIGAWDPVVEAMSTTTGSNRPAAPAPSTGPVVILGASYAASWPLTEIGGVPVVNKGVAGQQSFELLERFDRDVVASRPRAVVLWGFINDIFRAPADGVDASIDRIKTSYTEMIARARSQGIEPILATEVTIRPRAEGVMDTLAEWAAGVLGRAAYQDHVNRQVLAVNEWLIETAARERLLVLHFQQLLAAPGGRRRPSFAQSDGSHISPAGYDMLTSYAMPVLKEFIVDR
jgi:uncharacterized SAM-binding protein YcdF (DUF218 family)/lysophospholipase L1-like esterase